MKIKDFVSKNSSYCPLKILALKTCSQGVLKTITASSFKLSQLIEDNK